MYQAIERETITVCALAVRFLVESDDSNGTASVFECYVPANSRMPAPHSHDGFEETIYGLEGITSWTIDGETVDLGPGEAVCVKRGQIHGFQNQGSVDAKMLCIATPALFGESSNDRRSSRFIGTPPKSWPSMRRKQTLLSFCHAT